MWRNKRYSEIHKTLVFHHVLMAELRDKYKHADSLRKKQSIAKIVSGKMIKKYRMLSLLHKKVGMAQRVAREHCYNSQERSDKRRGIQRRSVAKRQ